jgi:tRNA-2-methylthio-N6-dimethylallyladenosine synthase
MNVHDSERMAGLLEQAGFEPTGDAADADLVVINTCSVRERAEGQLYTRLGALRQLSAGRGGEAHGPLVAVAGCVAQQEGSNILRRAPGAAGLVIGTQAIRRLPMLVDAAEQSPVPLVDINPYDDVSWPLGVTRRNDPVKAYVTIIEGCNEYCSFCVVPYTRGHERMRPRADILAEVREAAASGRKEVQLLGQIVNHYRAPDDQSCDFIGLLEAMHDVEGIERIRFASPHPRHFDQRFLDAMGRLPRVCRHLHLPVQSGSSRVLELMRRRYTREGYLELIARIRATLPDVALSTDMIVGFPGETDADFAETLTLTAAVRYQSMFSFKYSARPNTLAGKRMPDDVPEEEKTRRIVLLQALQRDIQSALHARLLGRSVEVLVDAASRRRDTELSGRTSGNLVVNFPGPIDWIGRTVPVRIERTGPNSVWGRVRLEAGDGAGAGASGESVHLAGPGALDTGSGPAERERRLPRLRAAVAAADGGSDAPASSSQKSGAGRGSPL